MEKIKAFFAGVWAYIKGRAKEFSTHTAALIGAAIAACQAANASAGRMATIIGILVFIQMVTPEFEKK